jgi:uncharacterized membrane protein YbhN (UPF0104 family)
MKKWIFTLVQVGLTAALAWTLFYKINLGAAWEQAVRIPPTTAILLFLLIFAQIGLVAWRMKLIARALGKDCSWAACLRSNLASAFVGQTPLTNFGGDVVRIWCIIREGLTLRDAASVVTLDRVMGLTALVGLVTIADFVLWFRVVDGWMRLGILTATGSAIGGIAVLLLGRFLPRWTRRWPLVEWLAELSATFGRLLVHPRHGAATLAISVLGHLVSIFVIYALFHALGTDVTLRQCLVLTPFPLLLSLLPLSVSGWGVREGALVVAFGLVGVPAATTLAVSVVFGVILLVSSLPGGLLLLRYPIPVDDDRVSSVPVR